MCDQTADYGELSVNLQNTERQLATEREQQRWREATVNYVSVRSQRTNKTQDRRQGQQDSTFASQSIKKRKI